MKPWYQYRIEEVIKSHKGGMSPLDMLSTRLVRFLFAGFHWRYDVDYEDWRFIYGSIVN